MHQFWNSLRRPKVSLLTPALLVGAAGIGIAGCGGGTATGSGSGSDARKLLSETFTGSHTVSSGVLNASISITPHGSSSFQQPLSIDFSGPFQSEGKGKLPKSDFNAAIHFEGQTGQLSVLSTGTAGYVILDNVAYKLPAATFQKIESGFGGIGGGSSSGSSSTGGLSLSGLGIHPADWLTDPEVVGTAQVGGAKTDHIHGTIAVGALLKDVSKILGKASSVTSSTPAAGITSLSPATQAKIAGEIKNATFDLWTGTSDHTIRKLTVSASLPVTGSISSELGGMTSATVGISFGYSDVGQPQTIGAPVSSQPYSQFQTKITELIGEIEQLAESDATSGG